MRVKTYLEAEQYLLNRLPMFFRDGGSAIRPGLTNIQAMCEIMGNPQNKLKCIHIGGTNGKGSVSNILNSVLQNSGYKIGIYTSPHLLDYRERILVNNKKISEAYIKDFINQMPQAILDLDCSFFELTVLIALNYFVHQKVDYAIIEVGMGGRLDSTNIINPLLSIITSISLDHTQYLGNTISKIAYEKAGIIKANSSVVINCRKKQTEHIFIEKAKQHNADILFANDEYLWEQKSDQCFRLYNQKEYFDFNTDLNGKFQGENICTAFVASKVLNQKGLYIEVKHFAEGLRQVKKNPYFKGRWEKISNYPNIFVDIAHNEDGIHKFLAEIKKIEKKYSKIHIVLGFMKDKDWKNIVKLFPKNYTYYLTQSKLKRTLPYNELFNYCKNKFAHISAYQNLAEITQKITPKLPKDEAFIVVGSALLVGEFLTILKHESDTSNERKKNDVCILQNGTN